VAVVAVLAGLDPAIHVLHLTKLVKSGRPLPKQKRSCQNCAAGKRLIRKFDPVERDFRNRALGKAGEEFVLELERNKLKRQDRNDLARKVRWISELEGDGAGFDILSYEASGKERLIEVKTTNGGAKTPFFLTRNERDVSNERADAWHLYRVHLFSQAPQIFTVQPPFENALYLNPESWRASFR
jgi:hypothetical protein